LANAAAQEEDQHVSESDEGERVLIMAPVGNDATAMAALLYADGFEVRICAGADECSRQIAAGTGALLLTEEALESPLLSNLLEVLKSAAPLVRIAAHYSHKRRRIAQGEITGFGGCGGRICYFAGAADQHPHSRPVNAGCITFSATPVPDARSRPTQE